MTPQPLPRPLPAILATHPVPWRYVTVGGAVRVLDAAGVDVPLFTVLDFAVQITGKLKATPSAL